MSGLRFHLVTFGCQMNIYDSQKMEAILTRSGYRRTGRPEEADLILLNTCSIREKAENKVFSMLGRLAEFKKNGADPVIALGGCMATLRKDEIFRRAPMVDVVFGPDNMESLPKLIEEFTATGARRVEAEFADHTVWDGNDAGPTTVCARVGIAKGCDNHCSYCIVPRTRGPEISRPPESILAEARLLGEKGCAEVTLIGQNVNSYGKGGSVDFPALLKMVETVPGIRRIRFMTSHPKDMGESLVQTMANSKKICPAVHMPVQAGSNRVLSAMNRGYTAEEYLEKVDRLRKAVPGVSVSSDVMVGFPGETEEDFQETLDVMKIALFDGIFLFNHSPRPGTKSAELPGLVTREVSQSRFDRANALHKAIMAEKLSSLVGTEHEVLCEGPAVGGGEGVQGRTPGNYLVFFDGDPELVGQTLKITIARVLGYNLGGKITV